MKYEYLHIALMCSHLCSSTICWMCRASSAAGCVDRQSWKPTARKEPPNRGEDLFGSLLVMADFLGGKLAAMGKPFAAVIAGHALYEVAGTDGNRARANDLHAALSG